MKDLCGLSEKMFVFSVCFEPKMYLMFYHFPTYFTSLTNYFLLLALSLSTLVERCMKIKHVKLVMLEIQLALHVCLNSSG